MHGQFVWYDLMTSDVAGAQRFYSGLTGWKTQAFEYATPDNPYTMWTNDGRPLGGVAKLTADQAAMGIPPHWLSSVQVNSVDETIRRATQVGGRVVVAPMEIPGTGRYAVLADPQGATIAVYQPQGPADAFDGTPRLGRHSWNELMTTDYRKAFDFYRQLFGWEKINEMDMGGGMTYVVFGRGGKQYGGMYNRTPEMSGVPPFWLPYINVRDAKKSTEAATRTGATVVNGPMEIPGGWITVMADPQGAAFAVHSVGGVSAAKPKAKAKSKAKAKAKTKTKPKRKAKAKARKKTAAKRAKPKKAAKSRSRPKARPKSRSKAKAKSKKRARRR